MLVTPPIVVDLGKASDDEIDLLMQGTGPLVGDIEEVMRLLRRDTGPQTGNRVFLPVVATYMRDDDDRKPYAVEEDDSDDLPATRSDRNGY
jgi:hypothetical protein